MNYYRYHQPNYLFFEIRAIETSDSADNTSVVNFNCLTLNHLPRKYNNQSMFSNVACCVRG